MRGRGTRGKIRPVGNGIDDLAPGENEHGSIVHRNRAEEREKQNISRQKQQFSGQEFLCVDHAAEKARKERREQNDNDAVQTRHRTVDHRAVLAVNAAEIERHEIAVLVVSRAAQRGHGKIQQDRRIPAEDRKNALSVPCALIRRAAAGLYHRRDVPHEKPDEDRRAADGNAADNKGKPKIVPEQQSAERRREDKAEIRAPVLERIRPVAVLERRDIGDQGAVCRAFDALEEARYQHERDRPRAERDAAADNVAHDGDDIADDDDVFLVEPVGELTAEKVCRHH